MNLLQTRSFLLLIGVCLVLLGVMSMVGPGYCALWLPVLEAELRWLLPAGALMDLSIATRADEQVYLAHIALDTLPVGSRDGGVPGIVRVSTLTGNVVQPLLIVLTVVLARTGLHVRQRCLALLGAMLVITLLISVDVPLVMLGALQEFLCMQDVIGCSGSPMLSSYGRALDRGGRLALALLGAWAAIASTSGDKR